MILMLDDVHVTKGVTCTKDLQNITPKTKDLQNITPKTKDLQNITPKTKDLQNITPKTKDRATRTPLRIGGKPRCSGGVSSSLSTCDTLRDMNII
jgi:hypothetical protein